MAKHLIKIHGFQLELIKTNKEYTFSMRIYPYFETGPNVLSNGLVYSTAPVKLLNGYLSAEVDDLPFPFVVFTIHVSYKIDMPVGPDMPILDMISRTGKVKTDNGKFVPAEIYCLELKHKVNVADLQQFLAMAELTNIWFGALPGPKGLYVEDNLLNIELYLNGIIGTMSGRAVFSLKLNPKSTSNPNHFVDIILEKTKGIGLIKGIVENAFEKNLIPNIESAVDDFIVDVSKDELKPLDDIVETLTQDRARVREKGLLLNGRTLTKTTIELTFSIGYPVSAIK